MTAKSDSETLGRTLQKGAQRSLHNLVRRHRPAPPSKNQRRPGSPALHSEAIHAVQKLSSGNTPGSDAINAEIYKHGGHQVVDQLTAFFRRRGAIDNLMLSAMLVGVYRDERPVVRIAYRTDGHLNSRLMKAITRLSTGTVHDLFFANDCPVNTATEADMQRNMGLFAAGCASFGLTIDTDKMVIMHQSSPNTQHCAIPQIKIHDQIRIVDNFASLGNALSLSGRSDD
ncbi:hypothetical protein SprV_0301331400 [Sparganum proliferum]